MIEAREGLPTQSLPARVGAAIWHNLPLLLLADGVLFIAAIPASAALFGGLSPLAPLLAAAFVGPVWAATIACAGRMLHDEAVGARDFVLVLKRHARAGVTMSLVPAAAASAALGTLAILEARPGESWLLLPLFVDSVVLVLALIGSLAVYSLATGFGLRGWTLWKTSLQLVAARPMKTAATVALLVLLAFLVSLLPGVLVVLPAPLALHLSASVWSTITEQQEAASLEVQR